jgi:hypothetical protein
VQQDIRVAVPDQFSIVRHIDAAQPQRASRLGTVRIFADAYPQVVIRGEFSSGGLGRNKLPNPRGLYRSGRIATTRALAS